MAKYLLIAAIVISLATAGLGIVNHGKLADTTANLESTKSSLVSTQKTLSTTKDELKKSSDTLATTDAEKTKLAEDLNTAQSEGSKAKADLAAATTAIAAKDTEINDLKTKIASVPVPEGENAGQDLKGMVDNLNQRIQEQEAQISSLSEKNKADNDRLKELQAKEVARTKSLMQPGLEGQVLAVNPAWNFVVLSIGDKQGAVNNAEMLIKRGGQYLGKVRITSVEPSTSIADIVANTLPAGVSVQPGDSVIFQAQE